MADGPDLALQVAIVARLKAHASVTALVGQRVYDEPPQGVTFPYIRIGTFDLSPLRLSGDCTDEDLVLSIECHSRPVAGRVEAGRMAHAVRMALDGASLSVAGYTFEWLDWTAQAVSRAPDGKSYIATVAFTAAMSAA